MKSKNPIELLAENELSLRKEMERRGWAMYAAKTKGRNAIAMYGERTTGMALKDLL